jgi:hypothetical protein
MKRANKKSKTRTLRNQVRTCPKQTSFSARGISLRPNNKDFLKVFSLFGRYTSLGIHLSLQARDFFLISASKQRSLCPKGEVLLSECRGEERGEKEKEVLSWDMCSVH